MLGHSTFFELLQINQTLLIFFTFYCSFWWFFSVQQLNYNGGSFRQGSHWIWVAERGGNRRNGQKGREGRGWHTWRLKPLGKMNQQPGGNVTSIVRACRGKRKWKMQRGGFWGWRGCMVQPHLCPPFSACVGAEVLRGGPVLEIGFFCKRARRLAGGRKVLFWK